MIRQCKKVGMIMGISLMITVFSGCGNDNNVADTPPADELVIEENDPDEGKGDIIPDDDQLTIDEDQTENSEGTDSLSGSYSELYLNAIGELTASKKADQFALVNIDEDDIPELVASDSKGSYDDDNAFVYTVSDGKAVLLINAVTGLDGTSISFCEGKNLIRLSGGITGASDVYSEIKDGKLEEVFKVEMIDTFETDADDEEIYTYSVNGKDVKKAEYLDEYTKFIEPYGLLTEIDYDGLNKIKYVHDQNMTWFEQTEQGKYITQDEITKQLKSDG